MPPKRGDSASIPEQVVVQASRRFDRTAVFARLSAQAGEVSLLPATGFTPCFFSSHRSDESRPHTVNAPANRDPIFGAPHRAPTEKSEAHATGTPRRAKSGSSECAVLNSTHRTLDLDVSWPASARDSRCRSRGLCKRRSTDSSTRRASNSGRPAWFRQSAPCL